jgi:DNA polymerase V
MNTYALVDCNNFYVSCERLFRPDLKNRPVLVLSNNDGCVISRSAEVKALGIRMGVPYYQLKDLIQAHHIAVFSSNYALYADLSNRVQTVLESMVPRTENYSIDESFLDLSDMTRMVVLESYGREIKRKVEQWTGIPVCVGIAPTKTLAKLANHAAKIYKATGGVVDLTSRERQRRLLALMPVEEIWGVGRKLSQQLQAMGIRTALQLAGCDPKTIRKQFSVVLERTVHELNGVACVALEDVAEKKQQIMCSRSFGQRITEYQDMREAICDYAVRAAEKLRQEKQYAKSLTVFLRTNPNACGREPYYANSATASLPFPTDDTRDVIEMAQQLLIHLWRDGFRYMKAGIMLGEFYDPGIYQYSLFDPVNPKTNSEALMAVLDKINFSGKGNVWFAGQGVTQPWAMQRGMLSPRYTTNWQELVRVG